MSLLLATLLSSPPAVPARGDGLVVLPFLAKIDGSDRIRITREGAEWTHLHWGFPEGPVLLNDVLWNPREAPRLANHGPQRFLPTDVDFGTAEIRRIEGRDAVVLEREPDAVTIHLDDTPLGAGVYRFDLLLRALPPAVELRVAARIDGSDELRISGSGAEWVHRHWGWPEGQVRVNGHLWFPQAEGVLPNSGRTRFLLDDVDFASAEIVSRTGRDLVALEKRDGTLLILFADNPNGSDFYEIVVRLRRALLPSRDGYPVFRPGASSGGPR